MQQYFDMDLIDLEAEIARDYATKDGFLVIAGDADLNRLVRAIRSRLAESVSAIDVQAKQLICERLDYCARKNSEGLALARELVDAGLMVYFLIPVPPIKLAAYVIRQGYLDHLCACKI